MRAGMPHVPGEYHYILAWVTAVRKVITLIQDALLAQLSNLLVTIVKHFRKNGTRVATQAGGGHPHAVRPFCEAPGNSRVSAHANLRVVEMLDETALIQMWILHNVSTCKTWEGCDAHCLQLPRDRPSVPLPGPG